AKKDIAFEDKQGRSNLTITGKGTITSGDANGFRFENVSLNGTDTGLSFITQRAVRSGNRGNGNITNHFNGTLNISGRVNISMISPNVKWYDRDGGRTYWNITTLNVASHSNFTLSIDSRGDTTAGQYRKNKGLNGITFNGDNTFNVNKGSTVNFHIYSSIITPASDSNYASFNGNISVLGGGRVNFKLNASSSSFETSGVIIKSKNFNVSGESTLNLESTGSTKTAFLIKNNLTLNATGGNIQIKQIEGTDSHIKKGVVAEQDIIFEGGNITLGSQKAPTEIKGNVTVKQGTNATLRSANFDKHKGALIVQGNVTANGNLTADGDTIEIKGNLDVAQGAKFNGSTKNNLNITGTFINNGDSKINISQGAVNLGNITNNKSLSITTNAKNGQKSIIRGDIINKKGNLNITDNNSNAEIEIAGNISQKEGNLTISSDKVNIIKKITIKADVDGESSSSSTASDANLTIKTKELKLAGDLNISGFNKAEITAKDNSDLTIGETNSGGTNTKKVTFNNVKNSEISANGHNVTLNSEVETSNGGSNAGNDGNDNSTGLTISAKDVTVNNNVTSHKTINISAAAGNVTTKEGTTINATTGSVEVTAQNGTIKGNITSQNVTVTATENLVTTENAVINATSGTVNISTKTGDIKGGIESASGNVNITASGNTLKVSNITGQNVTVTASSGAITTTEGSTINGTDHVTTSSQSGDIGGTISGKTVNVKATERLTTQKGSKIEATEGEANVTSATGTIGGTISGNTVSVTATDSLTTQASSSITSSNGQTTLTAKDGSIAGRINAANVTLNTTGTLTTAKGSDINATGTLAINAKNAKLDGTASGDRTAVNATNANGSGSVIAKTSSSVNITGDLNTVNGLNIISKDGRNTVRLRGKEIEVKYIQPGVASVEEVIEAKRVLEKVKDLSDEERETLAKLGVSAVRFVEPNNTITVNTQNEFTTRPSSQVIISEGKACFSSGNGAAVCTNVADDGQP
ncbi:TPA: beta strand repeat-containing protein, partial [Haemophilus influenzae]